MLRPMVAADAPVIAGLATQLGYPSSADEIATRFDELRRRDDDEVIVATGADDAPIGWVHVARVASLVSRPAALIGGLVVDEARRSSGVGSELLAAAETWARGRGATTIFVTSRTERARAHRFYEREGYVQIKLSHVFEKPLV